MVQPNLPIFFITTNWHELWVNFVEPPCSSNYDKLRLFKSNINLTKTRLHTYFMHLDTFLCNLILKIIITRPWFWKRYSVLFSFWLKGKMDSHVILLKKASSLENTFPMYWSEYVRIWENVILDKMKYFSTYYILLLQ